MLLNFNIISTKGYIPFIVSKVPVIFCPMHCRAASEVGSILNTSI